MHLWQLDLVGGMPLADGREAKMVTGIDDHSPFVVTAAVVAVPSGRALCDAFTAAMRRYGVPFEVLSDIQRQAVHWPARPAAAGGGPVRAGLQRERHDPAAYQAAVADHDREIERWHKTLRRELLDHVAPFESLTAARPARA